ncbi:anoctamin-8-like [Balaenoptera musculus]|uniref:Anoctamin-8-like n=1 Tax=Balaenoptera musculus TaxID=9771 RepID=A0A8B8Y2C2_BALMU|nr:anoctamin-8-like [Balaenoptera musculus]
MGSVEQGLGRGLALAAGADWHAANLPAALQGGARRAIFRGLYKGAEKAVRWPGSASARDWEGSGDTCTGSRDAEATGLGPHAGLRPSLGRQVEPQAAGACAPQRGEGRVSPFWRGRGRSGGCQGAEKKRQRRKRHTMEQNKGECAKTAACPRLARRAQSPPPAPPAPLCVPPRPAPPRPPSLLTRRRGPGGGHTRS